MKRYSTKQGTITIESDAIKVPARKFGFRSPFSRTIPAEDVAFITVGALDRQYVTGNRAAGVVLTGGLALLAPSRKRASIVVATEDGEILSFDLAGSWAKDADMIRARAAACGYRTSPPANDQEAEGRP